MSEYAREDFRDTVDEILPLVPEHLSAALYGYDVKPEPKQYQAAEDAGQLRLYTQRAGSLVGYAIYLLRWNPDHQATEAMASMIYVQPKHRPGVGLRDYAEDQLRAEGVARIFQPRRVRHTPCSPRRYRLIERLYVKELQ